MAKATTRVKYMGASGLVQSTSRGSWDFIYTASTVKNPNFNIGDRCVLPDGREFRYAKSSAACISGQGCEFTYTGYVAYTAFATAEAVGDTEITIPAATHATLTEDELVGGYVLIFDGSTNNTQFRQIVGNDAAVADALFKVYLDGPLTEAVVSGTSCVEVYQNPYAALRTGTTANLSKAGVPAVKVTAADTYFWVQVKGLVWSAPQANLGNAGGKNGGFWHDVGNISDGATALGVTIPAAKSCQYAGYTVTGSVSGNGPLFMLTG
jgi:hypothetical protein